MRYVVGGLVALAMGCASEAPVGTDGGVADDAGTACGEVTGITLQLVRQRIMTGCTSGMLPPTGTRTIAELAVDGDAGTATLYELEVMPCHAWRMLSAGPVDNAPGGEPCAVDINAMCDDDSGPITIRGSLYGDTTSHTHGFARVDRAGDGEGVCTVQFEVDGVAR